MVTAVPLPSSDLSPQKIHQLLKQSPPEAQYKLRCSLHKDQVWSCHSVGLMRCLRLLTEILN